MNTFQIYSSSLTKLLLSVSMSALIVAPAGADEWGQWMGPNRDGVYRESGIIDAIPESGLKIKWRMPIHGGYAGPAVADGKVFVFDFKRSDGKAVNHPTKRVKVTGEER